MATSTKPYMVRALHEWCTDNGLTPHIVVWVNEQADVPHEYVKNNEIVLNIDLRATKNLQIANDWLSFSARFGGVSRDLWVPIGNIISIFARETGEGMGFEVELVEQETVTAPVLKSVSTDDESQTGVVGVTGEKSPNIGSEERPSGRPSLRIVK
ncbi:ClpXP protease specificity-enhancing factor [Neisseriaceae bacterium TC5R-5]|nr:ClpXP protease specificity-enhancing factor [Neisseriaceae bacterium TC5R-5]